MSFHVLVVDDSPVMRRFVRRTLELSGFPIAAVLEAADGSEALDVLDRARVDVILTDLNMPVMDGVQFLEALRRDPRRRTLPVVVVSTDSTAIRLEHLIDLGANGYVRKPFLPERLREELESVLEAADGID